MNESPNQRAARWEQRYESGDLPWDSLAPDPELFRRLSEIHLSTGRIMDLGCGTGTNAIALAQHGFDVIGCDISPKAIVIAKRKATIAGCPDITFEVADILEGLAAPGGPIDAVFDRGCFHSVEASTRQLFAQRVAGVLREGGWWITMAGNRDDEPRFDQPGPPQMTASQITTVVEPLFQVYDLRRIHFQDDGKPTHLAWSALLRKR